MVQTAPVTPAERVDEDPHEAGAGEWWSESYYLDFFDPAHGLGGYVRIGFMPNRKAVWYWACLVGPDRRLVAVIDHEVSLPRGRSREVRSEGLWADYTVETPLDHVTVGLESFAVAVDDPAEAYGAFRGERVPFGLDLEWETDGGTYQYPGVDRYEVPCRVHGDVLLGQQTIAIDGWGQRDHSWGERDWWAISWSWTAGRLDDGTRFHGTSVDLDGALVYGTGYLQPPGEAMTGTDVALRSETLGEHGFPTEAAWQVGGLEMVQTPVAFAPVLLESPDGRVARFPRAWTTVTTADGRSGHAWTEWNQRA